MKELRRRAKHLKPILSIGKNGVSEGSIELIARELEQKKLIKIKMLKSAIDQRDKKEIASDIARKTQSQVVEQIGNIVVLYKK